MQYPRLIYFIGIGGIGMSGLARYFHRTGAVVAGYDAHANELTRKLQGEGIEVLHEARLEQLPQAFREAPSDELLVVYTPAVPGNNPLLAHWRQRGVRIMKRSEVLGEVTRHRPTVAVAGTHGKTTVTTMLAHFLHQGNVRCNAFLGGISTNYGTNVLLDEQARFNVVEADEYDRSFLQLHPDQAIITAIEPDHLDVYGSAEAVYEAYADFAALVKGGLLVNHKAGARLRHHAKGPLNITPYSLDGPEGPHVTDLRISEGIFRFNLISEQGPVNHLSLGMPGRHNVENAVAAASMALRLGVEQEHLREALASFNGVERRFQVWVRNERTVYIDDYAHHPAELDTCIASVRELWPGRRITGVFQPHLYSRTKDLATEFANSLNKLDQPILLPIYPAREEPLPGIDSQWLARQMANTNTVLCTKEELLPLLQAMKVDILLTLGAGDIGTLAPRIAAALDQEG